MSTKVCDRKESPILYMDVARELYSHSLDYLTKLGDKKRTLIQVPLLSYVRNIIDNVVIINRVKDKREEYIITTLCILDSFELQLSVIQEKYKQCITDYGWLTFGKLISQERQLLRGLLEKK